MKYLIILIPLLAVIIYELFDNKKDNNRGGFKKTSTVQKYKYEKKPIMTPVERKFYDLFINI